MAEIRSLFSKIILDAKGALANLVKFNDGLDKTKDGLGDAEKQSKETGEQFEKDSGRAAKFAKAIAEGFKRAGRVSVAAGARIRAASGDIARGVAATTAAVGAAGVAVGALTVKWAENSLELQNASKRYQVSTDDIQAVSGALSMMGLEAEDGLEAIKELRIRLGEAKREGTSPLKEALTDLGVSFEAFDALPLLDQMAVLADRLSEVQDESRKTALANDVAGEDLIKLLPLLEMRAEGVDKLIEKTRKLNLIQSKESIKAGAMLAKSWKTLLALLGSVVGAVAEKVEPAISSLIDTTRQWFEGNRKIITSGIADFFERLVRVSADFIPVAVEFADSLLKIVEGLGGVQGAVEAVIGTMAIWKLSTAALLGPGGPWLAGLAAVTLALRVFGKKVEQEDARISKLANKRQRGLGFRRRGEFTTEELQAEGDLGSAVLQLEAERSRLIAERNALGVPADIGVAREELTARFQRELPVGGVNQRLRDAEIRSRVAREIQRAGKLEDNIDKLTRAIEDQIAAINEERTKRRNDEERARRDERKRVSAEAIENEKEKRARVRELTELFRREKIDKKQFTELDELIFALGLDAPEGFEDRRKELFGAKDGAGKAKKPKEKTIEELIGLGPEGVKTLADLVPAGQGTTINNFAFNTTVEPADVDITINPPPGSAAQDIAAQAASVIGKTISDSIHSDQRELIGQVIA